MYLYTAVWIKLAKTLFVHNLLQLIATLAKTDQREQDQNWQVV